MEQEKNGPFTHSVTLTSLQSTHTHTEHCSLHWVHLLTATTLHPSRSRARARDGAGLFPLRAGCSWAQARDPRGAGCVLSPCLQLSCCRASRHS